MAYSFADWLGAVLILATLLLSLAQLRMAFLLFADGLPSWRPETRPVAGIAGMLVFAALLAGGIAPESFLRPIAAFAEELLRAVRPL